MKLKILENYDEMSVEAARLLADLVREKPTAVLGLATGSTPVGTYRELVRRHLEEGLDFSKIKTVNLDEYVGLAPEHPQSYHTFMDENLFSKINVLKENVHLPDGNAEDLTKEGKAYDQKIQELGGIDLQVLGIGGNGHIGFNEPAKALVAGTHVTALTKETIEANARFFDHLDEVPKTAISMGMQSILSAKKILLLASGEAKAEAIYQLTTDAIDPLCPATFLKLHPDVTVLVDKAAAKKLS